MTDHTSRADGGDAFLRREQDMAGIIFLEYSV